MSKSRNIGALPRSRPRLVRYFIIAAIPLLLVFGGLAAFNYVLKPMMIQKVLGSRPQPATPVTVVSAKSEKWRGELVAIGTIEAVRGVTLAPQVAGRVESIQFESGKWVKSGETVLQLDVSTERAQLQAAVADLRLKELNLMRARELAERGNMAQANLDTATAQREQAAAQVELIRAQISQKTIVAPFAGRLGIRQVNLGQYLAAGAAIVTLQSVDPIFVNFMLPEREIPRLKVGQSVRVVVEGLRGREFAGTVTSIDAKVDEATRNLMFQATLENKDGALVPGTFARLRVELAEETAVVAVPETAVTFSLYGDAVYVVVEGKDREGKPQLVVERRFVRVADRRNRLAGLSQGVKEGERVVTSGQLRLQPGVPVVIDGRSSLQAPKERPKP